jgi:serine/threonine-protein kinase
MNTPSDPRKNPNQPQPRFDQTFIEGDTPVQQTHTNLQSGTRIPATSTGGVNPYTRVPTGRTQTGGTGNMNADMLPTGNEPIPLGSGTIVSLLGAGGMARVYKIWNEKLEVFRAVKILIPGQSDLKNRFDTEAKITAKLHHANIVEIYNVGDWNNLPYLEMEFIDGESLEAFISKYGMLPAAVCSSIAILVARALAYAHSQEFLIYGKTYHGVIHRDLKPANIMISKSGEVRLMDFGIARPTEASLHTVEGNIVGTMQYLSPEQMDGVDIDGRTDIYSFGAILYEMLTGTKTFPQDTITNLMKKKIMNEYRRFTDFEFAVQPALSKISQKCLQLNKEDRFPDVDTMLRELENVHRNLTSDAPGRVLKNFLNDPESYKGSNKKSFNFFSPKILVPVGGVVAISAVVAFLLLTSPSIESTGTTSSADKKPADTVATIKQQVTTTPTDNTTSKQDSVAETVTTPPHIDQVVDNKPKTNPNIKPKTQTNTVQNTSVDTKPKNNTISDIPKPKDPETTTAAVVEQSPMERLKTKYGTSDPLAIGKAALSSRAFSDAITALEATPENHPDAPMKPLLLLQAYIETGRNKDALFIANSESPVDAQYDYLCGKLYEKMGRVKQALDLYQSSLTKPSIIRNRNEIRNDALFSTAMIWSDQYKNSPSADTRIQALNAWNIVKRTYSNNPDSERFKIANKELASIQ